MAESYELLITRLDGKQLAVLVSTISEVINAVDTCTFIDKPDGILGLINLRGEIVPVHDLRFHLDLPPREMNPNDQILIVYDGNVRVGVAVDSVETVRTYGEEQLFAYSLSPNAFRVLKIKERQVELQEIKEILLEL